MPRVNYVLTSGPAWQPEQNAINTRAPHQTQVLNRFADIQGQMSQCTIDYLFVLRHVCAHYPARVHELFGNQFDLHSIQFLGSLTHLDLVDMQHTTAPFFLLDPTEVAALARANDLMAPLHRDF